MVPSLSSLNFLRDREPRFVERQARLKVTEALNSYKKMVNVLFQLDRKFQWTGDLIF